MQVNYYDYARVCRAAVTDDELFKTFKRDRVYTGMLEHVTEQQGIGYLNEIRVNMPYLFEFIDKFKTNDNIGSPYVYTYTDVGDISPTTLRYIKVLADLINLVGGRFDDLDIVEVGVGYGGQCKIIHDFSTPKSYTMIDLPNVLSLARKCNEYHGLKDITYVPSDVLVLKKNYDLFISNYAFSEIDRKYQEIYAELLIKNSRMGYITYNKVAGDETEHMTREEVIALRSNHTILPEIPLTALNNFIYTWK